MPKPKLREQDHVHKLKRHKYPNGTKVYFCTNNCSYKIETAFAVGKIVLCNICGEEFEMNEYSIKLARPHCNSCGKIKIVDPTTGKANFISKSRPTQALADVAKTAVSSMKDRMSKVVTMAKEEDLEI